MEQYCPPFRPEALGFRLKPFRPPIAQTFFLSFTLGLWDWENGVCLLLQWIGVERAGGFWALHYIELSH